MKTKFVVATFAILLIIMSLNTIMAKDCIAAGATVSVKSNQIFHSNFKKMFF